MAGLAAGMAVVTTIPQVPSAHFRDGDNVALVPPGDKEALARRVKMMVGRFQPPA